MSAGFFRARITFEPGDTVSIETWDDELTPIKDGRLPVRDWVREHLQDYSDDDLRELCGVPSEGVHEALIEGEIRGFMSGWEIEEYEEELNLKRVLFQPLPDEWFGHGPLTTNGGLNG